MNDATRKQVKALELGIKALKDYRRRMFFMGEVAYTQQGIRDMTFAESGHKNFVEYTKAIDELGDLIEILTDPGVTIDEEPIQERLL
jgi:hypothetical protein